VHSGTAESGKMWTGFRCQAIFIIDRMHAIDTDQQNMLGLAALKSVVVCACWKRCAEQDKTERQSSDTGFQEILL
jgi:hypothetical protein